MTFVRYFIEIIVLYTAIGFLHLKKIRKKLIWLYLYERVDFRTKTIPKDKNDHLIVKRPVHQEATILNVYALINRVSKHMKQKLIELQGKIDKSTIIVRDFSTLPQ